MKEVKDVCGERFIFIVRSVIGTNDYLIWYHAQQRRKRLMVNNTDMVFLDMLCNYLGEENILNEQEQKLFRKCWVLEE